MEQEKITYKEKVWESELFYLYDKLLSKVSWYPKNLTFFNLLIELDSLSFSIILFSQFLFNVSIILSNSNDYQKSFGNQLKELLKTAGITQLEFSQTLKTMFSGNQIVGRRHSSN